MAERARHFLRLEALKEAARPLQQMDDTMGAG
jgi:hypothetical protein